MIVDRRLPLVEKMVITTKSSNCNQTKRFSWINYVQRESGGSNGSDCIEKYMIVVVYCIEKAIEVIEVVRR